MTEARHGAERSELVYRRVLSLRIDRNRLRLMYDQDGRGHQLTEEQRHALQLAVIADDADWFRSWLSEVKA